MYSGYQEKRTGRPDGKPLTFIATADSDNMFDSSSEPQFLYSYEFTYRQDGTLEKKAYSHDPVCSTNCSRTGYYDTAQRLVFEEAYITHGHLEYYTIYAGNSKKPACRLELDYDIGGISACFTTYQ